MIRQRLSLSHGMLSVAPLCHTSPRADVPSRTRVRTGYVLRRAENLKNKMPRKPAPGGRKIGKITEEAMKEALEEVLRGKSIRLASKENNIPFTTLYRYNVKMKARGCIENIKLEPNYAVNKIFDDQQEMALNEYFSSCALMFYGLSTKDCRKVAYEMAVINKLKIPESWTKNQLAGIDWLKAFRKRHPDLSLRRPEACSLARATAFNPHSVKGFFDNLHNVYSRHPRFADGTRVFNLDETATTTVHKPQKVIGPKGKNINKVTSGERGTLVTTCLFICATGYALPPVLVFPRVHFKEHMMKGAPPGSLGLATPTGWMNTETFVKTMAHFIKQTSSSTENPTLLVMDNHESHLSIEALDLAKANGVTILTLHPHTTARMQPLDVGINAPFKTFYNGAVDSWMMRNINKPVTIYDVAEFVGIAFNKAMTPTNITNAFKKTGIFPFDRNVFTEDDFLPSSVTDRPDPQCSNVHTDTTNIESNQGNLRLPNPPNLCNQMEVQFNEQELSLSNKHLGHGHHNKDDSLPSLPPAEIQVNSQTEKTPVKHTSRQPGSPSNENLGLEHHNKEDSLPSLPLAEIHVNIEKEKTPVKNTSCQPGCSSQDSSSKPAGFIHPNEFRAPIKAQPRKNTRKRKAGRSFIATDTPEKEAIKVQKESSKNKKVSQKPKKTAVRKVLQNESDSDDAENENISIHDEDSDWCEEDETETSPLTDEQLVNNILPRIPIEGDYVLVRFDSKKKKSVYYAAKILHNRNNNLEFYVSYLRGNRTYQFKMPTVPDLAYVKDHDIKMLLPKPSVGGSTLRQQSYYCFDTIDFSLIDIR